MKTQRFKQEVNPSLLDDEPVTNCPSNVPMQTLLLFERRIIISQHPLPPHQGTVTKVYFVHISVTPVAADTPAWASFEKHKKSLPLFWFEPPLI